MASGSELLVAGMSREKSGAYACEAENGIGSPLSAEFRISVQGIVCMLLSILFLNSPASQSLASFSVRERRSQFDSVICPIVLQSGTD